MFRLQKQNKIKSCGSTKLAPISMVQICGKPARSNFNGQNLWRTEFSNVLDVRDVLDVFRCEDPLLL